MSKRYVSFFTDFGFKRLFGSEPTKDCLIDFLNALLEGEERPITQLNFKVTEQLGATLVDRRAVFDLYCENDHGEKFIVELQKAKQKFFKDRTVFYSTFPIQEQAQKNEWDYQLKAVYTVGILDFIFDDDGTKNGAEQFHHVVKLTEQTSQKVFYDKLTFVYLEMPKFTKTVTELTSHLDKWLFAIRNLSRLEDTPGVLTQEIFQRFFRAAEIAQLNPEEREAYEQSLKYYRDLNNVVETAHEEGYQAAVVVMTAQLEEERRLTEEARAREEEERRLKEEALLELAELKRRVTTE